jgi:hypothetical protein
MRSKLSWRVVVIPILLTQALAAQARRAPVPPLNPKSYTSTSGKYSITVDPTDIYGRGPGKYELKKDAHTLWEKQLPYTLQEACVSDEGIVAGYSYTHGMEGFSEEGHAAGPGEFIVSILSPDGSNIAEERHRREESTFLHSDPDPNASGISLDETGKRFIVRVADANDHRIEHWWVYDLNSGKRLPDLNPHEPMPKDVATLFILKAHAVPGTPLVLAHWWKYSKDSVCGAVFTLVDASGKPVWTLTLDDDYEITDNEDAEDRLRDEIQDKGVILDVSSKSTFDVRFVKENKRVSFAVEKSNDGSWQVDEISRIEYSPAGTTAKHTEFPAMELAKIETVQLGIGLPQNNPPVSDIVGFDFAGEDGIAVLCAGPKQAARLVFVSPSGEPIKELAIPAPRSSCLFPFIGPASVGDKKFVVAAMPDTIEAPSEIFLTDFSNSTIVKLPIDDCPAVKALAGFNDGRFAALTERESKYSSTSGLFFFDSNGVLVWKKEQDGYSGAADELLGPEDIARVEINTLAVLSNIQGTIQFFNAAGEYLKSIDLEKAWGRKPNYPTNLASLGSEGFTIYDFDAPSPLVVTNSEGTISSEYKPRLGNGLPFGVRSIENSPQGHVWASDGDCVVRFSADGVVDRTIGNGAETETLLEPSYVTVCRDDRVYISDRRSLAVHVFDASGKSLGARQPNPSEISETSFVQHISLLNDGRLLLGLAGISLQLDSGVQHANPSDLVVDNSGAKFLFHPTPDRRWHVARDKVLLVTNEKRAIKTIDRRPDGQWLEDIDGAASAPDGSLAIVASDQFQTSTINTYDPMGEPRGTIELPRGKWFADVAYDGLQVYVRDENTVSAYTSNGKPMGQFGLDASKDDPQWNGPFLAAKGKQLWFVDSRDMTLHKYMLPM